ncbi:MAG TPA: aspartate ammonia-lyase, partial [Mariprofundaceae bacterium]|nr:aspartate ammonia-lyase [Mariprofundaceae bacterium]
ANRERCAEQIEWSMSMVTALAPRIGYDRAAAIAKQAVAEGKTVRQVCLEQKVMEASELDRLLDPATMLKPHA